MKAINLDSKSHWQSSFTFDHIKCLIVCRGPIRLETINVFKELNINYGILLSDKDSILFTNTLAPELKFFNSRAKNVHHITDYVGNTKEDKELCAEKIIQICLKNGYSHIFAGYGFMAEDHYFVSKIEKANLSFIGPNSNLIRQAGSKDEAKKLARLLNVSVIPGEENVTALTLLEKSDKDHLKFFKKLIKKHNLTLPNNWESFDKITQANMILEASYHKNIDLFSISDLQKKTIQIVKNMFLKYPGESIRFKHIFGGGGKGQRIINSVSEVNEAVKSVLVESKANGIGENKNFLIELNIKNTRHLEIQLVGNGEWCIELGGRDCSLQMHEQKLVEVSVTKEMFENSIREYEFVEEKTQSKVLRRDLKQFKSLCLDAKNFGEALNLDSVSTFECIADNKKHYFMEVNTRIQVEHRVTEMVYNLKFVNPNDPNDAFCVNSLIAAMVLIKCYGDILPCPERVPKSISGIEARINSTNSSLTPHSGSTILQWSEPSKEEIRDDQGIGKINSQTGFSQPYKLSGAYDSNVALSISKGNSRKESFENLIEIFRKMEIHGKGLNLNNNFIYGILNWFVQNGPLLKPNTNFVSSYLAIAGKIKELSDLINFEVAWNVMLSEAKKDFGKIVEEICEQKFTLLLRPLKKLFSDPHLFMGWIALQKTNYDIKKIIEIQNPNIILKDLYYFLNLDFQSKKLPSDMIWSTDQKLLDTALTFYKDVETKFKEFNFTWSELTLLFNSKKPPIKQGFNEDSSMWHSIISSHKGHQLALELLRLPILIAKEAGYFKLIGNDFFEIEIPEEIKNSNSRKNLISKLSPTNFTDGNEILATSGGIFYARENPDANDFVKVGQQVEKGQVLGLLEVMKMFNEIRANCSGTILKKCFDNSSGIQVSKNQILFILEPDEKKVNISKEDIFLSQEKQTIIFLKKIFSN